MSAPLVECVPNFSEGRDLAKVDAIVCNACLCGDEPAAGRTG